MTRRDPRLEELRRQVAEIKAARRAGAIGRGLGTDRALPDVMEFTLSDAYLNQRRIYPRQGTLLKTIFLQDGLFTEYDTEVLEEWMGGFRRPDRPAPSLLSQGWHFEGECGIPPDTLERITTLQAAGRSSFREVVAPIGRRGGKGHVGGIVGAYHLARILFMDDPHDFFEIPTGKVISLSVFAGNQPQAIANQWLDLVRVIVSAPIFWPYIQKLRRDRLIMATPADLDHPDRPWAGSIEIVARESTEIAGRGPASFGLYFDEMAHVTVATSPVSADRLYAAATPALDQFRGFDFIYQGSSPAHRLGQFYVNYQRGLELDPVTGTAVHPEILVVQLPSWGPYNDWDVAHMLPVRPPEATTTGSGAVPVTFPEIRRPIQVRDDQMHQLEQDDPAGFKVERLAQWADVTDPYLNPALITRMFGAHDDRMPTIADTGAMSLDYIAHGDPATRHDRFAWVIGHREGPDSNGLYHAWIDKIRYWAPADFDDHEIDYLELQDVFSNDIRAFLPYRVSFDQYSSVPVIQTLRDRIRGARLPKRVEFVELPHTHTGNIKLAEVFRTALTMGLVHCPYDQLADLELRFLQERNGRVDHPDSGPVTTNDVAVSLMVVVRELIGYENGFDIRQALGGLPPSGSPGTPRVPRDPTHQALSDFGKSRRGPRYVPNPARGGRFRRGQ